MQKELREQFNKNFTAEKYAAYLEKLDRFHPGAIEFRIAETPVFIPKDFTKKMLQACEDIIDVIVDDKFKQLTENAIPKKLIVPNENNYSDFIAFDFGICENENGELVPQLIEMQGFPTLFAFQIYHSELTRTYANVPDNYDSYLNGFTKESYLQFLKKIIIDNTPTENVILLEVFPEKQKTRVDFYFTEDILGIKTVCITKLIPKGNKLFYINDGREVQINKIYNRIIFDDLHQQKDIGKIIDITQPWDVEWIPHPNWFYRISKYTLPLIHNPYVPKTYFLHEIKELPKDLENYVLKPLFSFAGMGVVIDVTLSDIEKINDPENWILQHKVKYADIIQTPDGAAKAEIRLFYFRDKDSKRPIAAHNLARLSKGKMIGTRYNQDKTWVGGSIAFFEKL
ncbi:hypothetical protein LK994_08790 [Ferruginibacter lapsinanis]|uniref:hypothetical protein n=1 Tax=Ferruginibacter lapsinanis TaxID=563172 RepID=UPI001E4822EB|nr:hypothetical protein [Ferruginibacter lapsinanis]UEG48732.1 hypothetical protein LK994_08790 [Ferruginibacter lapsinanis]